MSVPEPAADPTATSDGFAAAVGRGWLRRVVRGRLGCRDAADDVMQEVALAAAACAAPVERPGAWLYRVALRQVARRRRGAARFRRLRERSADRAAPPAAPPDPLALLLSAEARDLVRAALVDLPDGDRDVLILKHVEGLTYAGVADRLGVSVHTVEDRLRRGRGRLRRALARRGLRDEDESS